MPRASQKIIPIYKSNGEAGALMVYPNLYNQHGEWIGWVTPQGEVYSVLGLYVGTMTRDPRIIRKRTVDDTPPRRTPPPEPVKILPPATIPLAPMMSDLSFETIDVLMDLPRTLHTSDTGELREDLD